MLSNVSVPMSLCPAPIYKASGEEIGAYANNCLRTKNHDNAGNDSARAIATANITI